MAAEDNLLDSFKRQGFKLPRGLKSLLKRAREEGASLRGRTQVSDMGDKHFALIDIQAGDHFSVALTEELAANHFQYHGRDWSWRSDLPQSPKLPVYRGEDAIDMYVETGSPSLHEILTLKQFVEKGQYVGLTFRWRHVNELHAWLEVRVKGRENIELTKQLGENWNYRGVGMSQTSYPVAIE